MTLPCWKHTYRSRAKARKVIRLVGDARQVGKTAYQCRWCGAWHRTSQRRADVQAVAA